MNKQYLKEHGLYDAHKQFMRLCEWSYSPTGLDEDDTQQDPNNAMGGNQDPMMGGGMQQGGQDSMMGADPMGATDPNMGGQNDMGGGMPQDPNAQADPNMGDAATIGDTSMDDMPMDDSFGEEDDEEDEDVIDVDDLTDAQEKINKKVNHVGKDVSAIDGRINQLMTALDKMERMINQNNDKIEQLNTEFQKRVQTPTEKLNLRSLDSYPFNVKPTEYWDKAVKDMPQYDVTDDNDTPTEKEYVIRQSDIDNTSDKEIEDSFDVIDDKFRQDISKIFGM